MSKEVVGIFEKYKVLNERELHARYEVMLEQYNKVVNIEGQLTSMMARTMLLPAALRYQAEVAQAVTATKAAGVDNSAQVDLLKSLTATISDFQSAIGSLDKALGHHADGDLYAHAKYMRDGVLPAMNNVRTLGDKLETVVADDHWPLPTYREMLFIK